MQKAVAQQMPVQRQQMAWGRLAQATVQEFHLLPECVPVLDLFQAVQTQWRYGAAGPTGLDYSGVRAHPAFRRIPRAGREEMLDDLCVMERAWLAKDAQRRTSAAQLET